MQLGLKWTKFCWAKWCNSEPLCWVSFSSSWEIHCPILCKWYANSLWDLGEGRTFHLPDVVGQRADRNGASSDRSSQQAVVEEEETGLRARRARGEVTTWNHCRNIFGWCEQLRIQRTDLFPSGEFPAVPSSEQNCCVGRVIGHSLCFSSFPLHSFPGVKLKGVWIK